MVKKTVTRKTPPKKPVKNTLEGAKKSKGKQPKKKGGKQIEEPVVETDGSASETDESKESKEISENDGSASESEHSVEGEEISENDGSESGSDELEEALEAVAKMAAPARRKKKSKKPTCAEDGIRMQPQPIKVDKSNSTFGQRSKQMEVGQTSKKSTNKDNTVAAPPKKRRRKDGTKLKVVEGHGSPSALYNVLQHLTTAQKKDVEDIGFRGLLELKSSAFIHTMIDWLLDRYDTVTRLFLYNKLVHFAITRYDVYDVFILPCTEREVPVGSDDKDLIQLWREKFSALPKGEISLERVKGEMMKLIEGGSDFKKLFLVFAMGSFLAPTVHGRVDLRLLGAVEDVAAILTMDWCSYVLDRFDFAVNSWKFRKSKSMGGCLMFFQLLYFHRLVWRGEPEKSTIPLIQHWTYEGLKGRMKRDGEGYKIYGGFGIGVWDLSTYPVSKFQPKLLYRVPVEEPATEEEVVAHEAAIPTEAGCRCLKLPLPDDLPSDDDLRREYNDVRTLKWMTTKRNLELVSRMHSQMALEFMEEGGETVQAGRVKDPLQAGAGLSGSDGPMEESFTQRLEDPVFFAEFTALGKRLDEMASKMVLPPSFDLGIGLEDMSVEQEAGNTTNIAASASVDPKYNLRYRRTRENPTAVDSGRPPKAAKKK